MSQTPSNDSPLHLNEVKIFEARPGVAMLLLPRGVHYIIISVSDDFITASGMKRVAVIGKDYFEVFPGNQEDPVSVDAKSLRSSFEYVYQHKGLHRVPVVRYEIPDGKGTFREKYWKSTNVPVLGEKGDVTYVIHSLEDVTAQVKSSHKDTARRKIEKAYNLFMQAPVAVCIVSGADHRVELVNDQMLSLLGRSQEMVGKPISYSLTEAKEQGLIALINQVYITDSPYHAHQFPAELLINGVREQRFFDLVVQPFNNKSQDRKQKGIFCTAYDITQQVLAQNKLEENAQELQLAIEAADLGTFRFDLLANKGTNSQKAKEWFGHTAQIYSREEWLHSIHPDDRNYVAELINATLHSEVNSLHDVVYRVIHPSTGVVRHLRSFGKTMFNDQGKPYLILGIVQDVTTHFLHQKQLESNEAQLQQKVLERTLELEKLNQDLMRSNQNLEEFAYAASHDMKEPIRKIRFFSDRLRDRLAEKLDVEDMRYFERMEAGTKRMSTLIDDLLVYSHVNRDVSIVEPVDLNQVILLVLDDLELSIEQMDAKVDVGLLPTIMGRSRQLQQLFENLIGNSLKYSKESVTPNIQISARLVKGTDIGTPAAAVHANTMYHKIQVQDNGIGFQQADAERIFTVFTRLHGNNEYRGTGVGLSIAHRVVQNHGGYIWAESEPGKGSLFTMLFPAD